MFFFISLIGRIEALFVSIPESVGLFAFGLGLIGMAMLVRWLIGRTEEKKEGEASPKA